MAGLAGSALEALNYTFLLVSLQTATTQTTLRTSTPVTAATHEAAPATLAGRSPAVAASAALRQVRLQTQEIASLKAHINDLRSQVDVLGSRWRAEERECGTTGSERSRQAVVRAAHTLVS
ncbi:hypothetical protein T492DRAFT_1101859 [Pavlovales sp. CCMP2436]|nr:hypothetical protein T492DRAFT_1101859 [Pavlovales sp. CCMP2436]